MPSRSFYVSATLVATTFIHSTRAHTQPTHTLHEERFHIPHQWTLVDDAPSDEILPVRVYLQQSNLENLDNLLHAVSDPDEPTYGQHYTAEQIADMFAPSERSVAAVTSWLSEHGIPESAITYAQSRGWLEMPLPVIKIEEMLQTRYQVYRHDDGREHVASTSYHVPAHLSEHIDFITPTLHFENNIRKTVVDKRTARVPLGHIQQRSHGRRAKFNRRAIPVPGAAPKHVARPIPNALNQQQAEKASLKTCDKYTTLDCLRSLYKLPKNTKIMPPSALGIVEYSPQSVQLNNFGNFMKTFVGKTSKKSIYTPKMNLILGGVVNQAQSKTDDSYNFDLHMEGNLDVSYAAGLTYPSTINYYQVGPNSGKDKNKGSFNNFLDAVDASYCSFQGGDTIDPGTFDVKFDKKQCGKTPLSKVISTSYNYNEVDLTVKYEQRQCAEYAKLGLQGVTVVYSSGDFGVASNSQCCDLCFFRNSAADQKTADQCLDPKKGAKFANGTSFNAGFSGLFTPSFPSSCPYVLSVGATEVAPGKQWQNGEQAAEDYSFSYSSGGGFSNNFKMPSYQKSAVTNYLKTAKLPNKKMWNSSGNARGYPDLSANGQNYLVALGYKKYFQISGTSASAPTIAAIFAMINQERAAIGKGPVGYVNPTIYKNAGAFNDITKGGNSGCGSGFKAAKGWDPVTGLGTPNYPKLLKVFLALP